MKMCAVSIVSAAMLASGSAALAQNVLVNPGFESGLSGWTPFGNVFADTTTPLSGSGVAKMFGGFSGGFNVGGMFQTFPAAPGQNWSFSANFRHNTGDNLIGNGPANSNWVISKIEFRNAADQVTGFAESASFDGRNARDVWTPTTTGSLVAPANTASVWAFFLFLQPSFDGGAVLIDDASLVPAPGVAGLFGIAGLTLAGRRRRAN
jgi:hypothetical protein